MTIRSIGSRTGATASSTAEMTPGQGSPCSAGAGAASGWHEIVIGGVVGELNAVEPGSGPGDAAGVDEGTTVRLQAVTIKTAAVAKRTARAAIRNPVTGSGARGAMPG